MKGYNGWSYRPYKPFLFDSGDIYICRVVPSENAVHFERGGTPEFILDIQVR